MFARILGLHFIVVAWLIGGSIATSQEGKKATGTIIGELKSRKNSADGKNTVIDVLAPGEEKARAYHVQYDAKIKGPIPSVLAAVRAASVGDRVELEWIQTGHGPAIKSFKVVRKSEKSEGGDKRN